jgi:signal transduction histidine kinase
MNKIHEDLLEAERLNMLRRYNILDTAPEACFDKITGFASKLFNVPFSLITLVDADRVWFKSRYGAATDQIERQAALCSRTILSDNIFVVEDADTDESVKANAHLLLHGIKFYAGAPLKVKSGHRLGTLCIAGWEKRPFSDAERMQLRCLAEIVVEQLELKRETGAIILNQRQVLNIAAHELKNPLTAIQLCCDILQDDSNDMKYYLPSVRSINRSVHQMHHLIEELLETSKLEIGQASFSIRPVEISSVVGRVATVNLMAANVKKQKLILNMQAAPLVKGDETRMQEIVDNLISNAIKYSPEDKNISIVLEESDGKAVLTVKDQGPGLTDDDLRYIFRPFKKLSARPTAGESSTGLGLYITKLLVEAHHGAIEACNNEDGGATFRVIFPVR